MRGTGPDEARGRRCVLAVLLAACAAACGGEADPVESTVTSDPPAAPAAPTAVPPVASESTRREARRQARKAERGRRMREEVHADAFGWPGFETYELDEEELAQAVADVARAVRGVLGDEAGGDVPVRVATSYAATDALTRENAAVLRRLRPDDPVRLLVLEQTVLLKDALFAKYAMLDDVILVVPENVDRLARLIDEPDLRSPEVLRAVLTHEWVHALDDRRHNLMDFKAHFTTVAKFSVFDAIVEGHAQHVARQICATAGWSEAFETFTRSVDKTPHTDDESLRHFRRAMVQWATQAYHQGERFVAAVHEARGAEGVAALFDDPPDDAEWIQHPDWYLDPSLRPPSGTALDDALDVFAGTLDPARWRVDEMSLSVEQMLSVLTTLPDEDREWVRRHVLRSRMVVANSRIAPGSRQIVGALHELRGADEARRWVQIEEAISRAKDEAWVDQAIRIDAAEYHPIAMGAVVGVYALKQVTMGQVTVDVHLLLLTHGAFVAELTWSNEPTSQIELTALGLQLLEEVGAAASAARGAAR